MALKYNCNLEKVLNAILWLVEKRDGITRLQVSKILFFADKYHMNRYGRPVLGDRYGALQYGPVPSYTLDLIKGDAMIMEYLDLDELPFRVEGRALRFAGAQPNLDLFSASDLEVLEESFDAHIDMGISALIQKSHTDPAWKDAPGHWMQYSDFIDDAPDKADKVLELEGIAPRMVF